MSFIFEAFPNTVCERAGISTSVNSKLQMDCIALLDIDVLYSQTIIQFSALEDQALQRGWNSFIHGDMIFDGFDGVKV